MMVWSVGTSRPGLGTQRLVIVHMSTLMACTRHSEQIQTNPVTRTEARTQTQTHTHTHTHAAHDDASHILLHQLQYNIQVSSNSSNYSGLNLAATILPIIAVIITMGTASWSKG